MSVSKRLRFEILKRDGNKCRYCGASSDESPLTIDHVVPVALGGTDDPSNLVAACKDCNAGKSASNPDAAVVEQVAEDALRWARAQSVAAENMLADLRRRDALRAEFKNAWSSWKAPDGRPVPLPDEWPESVDRFLKVGLPMPVLLDCMDKAMRRKKLRFSEIFRYMCGIAWSTVTDLRKRTAAEVGLKPTAETVALEPVHSARAEAFAYVWGHLHKLDDLCDPRRVAELADEFDDARDEDDTDSRSWDLETKAAVVLIAEQLRGDDKWGQRLTDLIVDELGLDYRSAIREARLAVGETMEGLESDPLEYVALRLAIQKLKLAASVTTVEA